MYKPALSFLVILGIVLVFSCFLYLEGKTRRDFHQTLFLVLIFLIGGTCAVYFLLVRPGCVHWWALPLGWLLCLVPNYIYAYHIRKPRFFGHNFTFTVFGVLIILPPGLVALILSAVELYLLSKGK